MVHRFVTLPTAEEADRLGEFLHEDNDGSRSLRPLATVGHIPARVSPDTFTTATASGTPAFGRSWAWPAATCELRWPGFADGRCRELVGTPDGAPPLIPAVAARMRAQGIRECVVWGAGEAGAALIRALRHEAIAVLLVTDSNEAYWGTELDGIAVVSPDDARARGNHVFAIGSCAFATDIEQTLRRRYRTADEAPQIFSPLAEVAA